MGDANNARGKKLFDPVKLGPLELANRIVMAPMTRSFAPDSVPTQEILEYYERRAASDVGLIITEGVWVDHPGAWYDQSVPNFYGDAALAGWKKVVDAVHAAGGKIMPQLWHVGLYYTAPVDGYYSDWGKLRDEQVGPSGMVGGMGVYPTPDRQPMTEAEIGDVIEAFIKAGEAAYKLGFDGVALHAGHGYIIDQFFWDVTNLRNDRYGGSIARRTTFAAEIVAGIRQRTSPDFPIMLRWSQWKLQDYGAALVNTPEELEEFLTPLVAAGVDIIDCSQRRYWEPGFEGSDLNLAAWSRKITGKPTMTVGSVGLNQELFATLGGETGSPASLDRLEKLLDRGDFDLVGVGRALLVDPHWASKVKAGNIEATLPFNVETMHTLY